MSTKGLKRLTVKAKRSMSGLNPFCDGYESMEKENETPDLEDFGCSPTYTSSVSSDAHHLSPSKESPSRRKKLMGSLRSIGSLRGLRSSHLKDRGNERAEEPVEPESPGTPIRTPVREREIRPSLTLNFERTPPDQPMFGALRRKRSTSSLVVHHSSPMPIPTPVRSEEVSLGTISYTSGLPTGTVPNTPGPLQMALEHDNRQYRTGLNSSPAQPRTRHADPILTPMPVTNLGFEDENVVSTASLTRLPSEPSSYFNIPIRDTSPRPGTNGEDCAPDSPISLQTQEAYLIDAIISGGTSIKDDRNQSVKAGQHDSFRLRCGSTLPQCNHHDKESERSINARNHNHVCERCYFNERASMGQGSSPINIEHILFDDDPQNVSTGQPSANQTYLMQQAEARMALHKQPHPPMASTLEAFPVLDTDPKPAQNTWGTHGSIYDGTGYGNTPSPRSARPSTSSNTAKVLTETAGQTGFSAASLAQESEAMARDHETLEEVIRAYAALEEEFSSMISEEVLEEVVAEMRADVELANEVADHSLGA